MFADQHVLAGPGTVVSLRGLGLAAVEVQGVLAFSVEERRREIGIRAALGAETSELVGSVVRGGLGIAVTGLIPGLPGAWALTRVLESMLFGVGVPDPWSWRLGTGLLMATAPAARLAPAVRAGRVSVVEVLNAEG